MSGQHAQAQKSMEEILSSIRETIEEDIKEGRRWINTPFGPAITPAQRTASDVLDLTQVVNDDGSLTTLTPVSSFAQEVPRSFQEHLVQESAHAPDLFLVEDRPTPAPIFGKKEPGQGAAFPSLTPENITAFSAFQTQHDTQNSFSFEKTEPSFHNETAPFQEPQEQTPVSQSPYISLQTPTPKQDFYYVAPEVQVPEMQAPAFVQPHEETPIMPSSPPKAAIPEILLNADKEVDSIQRALEGDEPEEVETQELVQEELQVEPQELAQEEGQEEAPAQSPEEVSLETPEAASSPEPAVEELLSKEAFDASSQALSQLTRTVIEQQLQEREFSPEEKFGQQTVDELMQSILRPILKEWLDAYLPSLVKWIVTEQIEKVMQQGLSTDKSPS